MWPNHHRQPGVDGGMRRFPAALGAVLAAVAIAGCGGAYAVSTLGKSTSGSDVCPNPAQAPDPALCFPGAHLPPEKAAILPHAEEQMAAIRRHHAVTPGWPPPAPSPQPPQVAGVVSAAQSPLPSMEFGAVDSWSGPAHGKWIVAYAGDLTHMFAAPPTGAIVLYDEPVNPSAPVQYFHRTGIFPAPKGDVRLKIIGYRGVVLTLKTQSGMIIHFDVATHAYSQVRGPGRGVSPAAGTSRLTWTAGSP